MKPTYESLSVSSKEFLAKHFVVMNAKDYATIPDDVFDVVRKYLVPRQRDDQNENCEGAGI